MMMRTPLPSAALRRLPTTGAGPLFTDVAHRSAPYPANHASKEAVSAEVMDTEAQFDASTSTAPAVVSYGVQEGPVLPAEEGAHQAISDSLQSTTTGATSSNQQPAQTPARSQRHTAPVVDLPLNFDRPDRTGMPLIPSFDISSITNILLGPPAGVGRVFENLFALQPEGQRRPIIYAPKVPRAESSPDPSSLPLLFYLPGIDGTGLAAYRQFPALAENFDLRALFIPPEDRMPFEELADYVAGMVEAEVAAASDPSRPVYLLGESFGGLMALALSQRVRSIDRLVLCNPATSFTSSAWPVLGPLLTGLPEEVYRLLPVALSPLLTNPFRIAQHSVNPMDEPLRQASALLYGLIELLPELSSLRVVLPPETLAWRLQLLQQGAANVNSILGQVKQRTLVLAGERDQVIPSATEGPRLVKAMPRTVLRMLPGRSHALLQEAGVDVVALMKEEGFYRRQRRTTTRLDTRAADRRTARHGLVGPIGSANFGIAAPLEVPTPTDLERALERGGAFNLNALERLVSPVYFSTDDQGVVHQGLDHVPTTASTGRPLLFVGNHQLFAPDMPLMIARFLKDKDMLLRGLAHPFALQGAGTGKEFGHFLESFGAVPVSGRNLYSLLEAGEAALLYPGGVREALKLKGEKYNIIWPSKSEFVRHACKFGAIIIPFAAIGAEDSVTQLLDSSEVGQLPLVSDWLKSQTPDIPQARVGVNASEELGSDVFTPPVISINPPARFYFTFGKPIHTDFSMATDRVRCDEMYGEVRDEVERLIGYMLRKRLQDPYADLGKRLLYEASWGGRKQAPTFTP